MTTLVPADSPAAIDEAAAALGRGLVVGVPTDTVYGLAVDALRPDAVARVFALKARPDDVALPVLVGRWDQVTLVAGALPARAQRLADRFWPGALTLVVPRADGFTADLGGSEPMPPTVGVRWPAHPVMEALCAVAGPLAVTSANRHGLPPVTEAGSVGPALSPPGGRADQSPGGLALVLDGGTCDGTPSTVVACIGDDLRCLREGGVPWAELSRC